MRTNPLRNDLQAAINILPEDKRLFAKILATENITIEHGNVPTAFFDLKNRLLMLPHWPNLNNDETEMLLSHEVGHAVLTPWEEWEYALKNRVDATTKAVQARPKDEQESFQTYLNVVEDARIERQMKERWPGLSKTFYDGYHSLHHSRDIFFIKKNKIDDAKLATLRRIDRLNLAAKIGAEINLILTDEEQKVYDRMMRTEEFSEVIALAEELFEHEKQQMQQQQQQGQGQEGGSGEGQNGQSASGNNPQQQGQGQGKGQGQGQPGQGQGGSGKVPGKATNYLDDLGMTEEEKQELAKQQGQGQGNGQQGQQGQGNQPGQQQGRGTKSGPGANACPEPSMTNQTWEKFVADHSGYDKNQAGRGHYYRHANMSSLNTVTLADVPVEYYSKFVEPVEALIKKFEKTQSLKPDAMAALAEWKRDFTPILSSMVQQFQRYQRAKESYKVLQAQTGKLDMLKLPFYKLTEDVFKRGVILPKGKNHGVAMLVDWSGSMGCYIPGVVEQMLMLAMFCERIRIPLEIYAFSDQYSPETWSWTPSNPKVVQPYNCGLIQFYSSGVNKTLRDKAIQCMFAVKHHYECGERGNLPSVMQLGGTPLHSSLMLMKQIIKRMRQTHKLDRQAFVVVTDGDAGDWIKSSNGGQLADGGTARDEKTGVLYRSKLPMGTIIEWLRDTTATTTIGVRLMHHESPEQIAGAWVSDKEDQKIAAEALRKRDAFIEIPKTDFDAAYAVRSNMLVSRQAIHNAKDPIKAQADQRRDLMRFTNAVIKVIA